MTDKEKKLWQEMADLTWSKCKSTCRILGSCCSPEYCQMAADIAKEYGVTLEPTGNEWLPFLGKEGCIVPPYFRQLCTLHQCKINALGFDVADPKWTKKYFKLRDKLSMIGFDEKSGL